MRFWFNMMSKSQLFCFNYMICLKWYDQNQNLLPVSYIFPMFSYSPAYNLHAPHSPALHHMVQFMLFLLAAALHSAPRGTSYMKQSACVLFICVVRSYIFVIPAHRWLVRWCHLLSNTTGTWKAVLCAAVPREAVYSISWLFLLCNLLC